MDTRRLHDDLTHLLRSVAADVVLPSFRSLDADEIHEKAPGDLVTDADRASEARISEGLDGLVDGARIVGEEATAADPSVLDGAGDGVVWTIDPIDGTRNYAEGRTPFALMVGLAVDGEPVAGWVLDPVTDRLCHAHRGHGAFIDDRRVTARATGTALPRTVVTSRRRRAALADRVDGALTPTSPVYCAGAEYPLVVGGEVDAVLFERGLPWDHTPGVVFLTEAGGRVAWPDGAPYRVGGAAERRQLLVTATPQLWDRTARVLFD